VAGIRLRPDPVPARQDLDRGAAAVLATSRSNARPLSWSPARKGGFGPALLLGIPVALLIAGAYLLVCGWGWIDPEMIRARPNSPAASRAIYIGAAIYWITANSLIEEYVWRWFVFRQFERADRRPRCNRCRSALGFTAHHVIAMAAHFEWRSTRSPRSASSPAA
jgi:membrane protease YdiL (CAAX protease family)